MKLKYSALAVAMACAIGAPSWADEAAAKKWIDAEFQPSTLSKAQQTAEMKWFIDAAQKLQAKGIKEI
jgi:glycerol transport system substrate-binding protein